MIFTGYMRPFETRLANNIELINDTCIVLCSYFLIIFSSLVSNAQTRYISGWPLIMLIVFIITLNLVIITIQAVKHLIRYIRLRYIRRKNRKLFNLSKSCLLKSPTATIGS